MSEPGRPLEQELQERGDRRIKPDLSYQTHPSSSPVLVLVGGQPGAGKTQAVRRHLRQAEASSGERLK